MTKINHQDNFASNLASNTTAGATTSTLNDTPSVSAPFYLAFDATDVNSNYEVLRCITSPGSGVVTHAATASDHTTAEEVRMVCPGKELDLMYQVPEGTLLNGKITPTDAAGLTLTLQTQAGTAPSVTDPVYVMIGGTLRSITAALSVAKADATNWCNSGSAELATKEVDYFAYLGYNATDGVVLGFSRIPDAHIYSDFSATTTNEKYCAISTITTAASGDDYVNIGRFAATLSAGAGYTWTVPTFTASNLIQRPIYESRTLSCVPQIGGFTTTTSALFYKVRNNLVKVWTSNNLGGTSNATGFTFTLPFASLLAYSGYSPMFAQDNGSLLSTMANTELTAGSVTVNAYKTFYNTAWTNTGAKNIYGTFEYEI